MKHTLSVFTVLSALALSSSAFAYDCRAIFDSGYDPAVQKLLGKKFVLVDEDKVDARTIPFRITVLDDVDVDPETLTFRVSLMGNTIIQEKREAGGFYENVELATNWLKNLPSCDELYRPHPAR
ncbi:MAG: hypothetical protein JST04_08495 [Bdellovibrionales bacterium]|nr:hypothetical protein [Bdellovibrionales bacterium]